MRIELDHVELRFAYKGTDDILMNCNVRISGELWDDAADRASMLRMAEIDAECAVQELIDTTA